MVKDDFTGCGLVLKWIGSVRRALAGVNDLRRQCAPHPD